MKLFLAVSIPEKLHYEIQSSIKIIRSDYPQFDWTPPENYHISIFFIGERSESKLPDIIEGIERIIYDTPSTQFSVLRMAMFVQKGIFLHLELERNKLIERIHNRLIEVVGEQVPQRHPRYIPHLSIAKYKTPAKQQYFLLRKKLKKVQIDLTFDVDSVDLYESIEAKPHNEYKKVHTFLLQG